ncbi:hypothetical protein HIM_00385 [Hirsutella minnesotensis 3608]|nr:hypothetical protein HIM_00385 [Hirsutella minnesotensis 3608]
MDARPFRPRGAENTLPANAHQRHKSTGTIAAMTKASTTGFRGPAKRAAFGDVTNMAKNVATARDEVKSGKVQPAVAAAAAAHYGQPLGVVNKENVLYNNAGSGNAHGNIVGKKDSLLRPAQRSAALASKPRLSGDRPIEVTKKPNSNAHDVDGYYVGKGAVATSRPKVSESSEPASGFLASQASIEGLPLQPRHHKSQPQLKQLQQPTLRRTQSKHFEVTDLAVERTSKSVTDIASIASAQVEQSADYAALLGPVQAIVDCDSHCSLVGEDDDYAGFHRKLPEISEEPLHGSIHFAEVQAPALSEPEDCWDEVDEEDYDDQDQAYTTAHSFRSRDLTTGGVTTMLAPRVNARVARELEEAKLEVQQTRSQEDVEEEMWDVSMVAEYGEEIFEYMRELEIKMLPNPHYMEIQTEIQWSMRSVLMDWLVQVHNRFSLLPETLFLTVNYIDRFLSYKVVSLGKLQLVGATAILVASKYEEINCPSLEEIVYMVDGGYSLEEILKAERFMLSMLSFELGWPGPMSFLRRVSKADDYDLETRTLAKYFLELTIMDERFVASPPSFLAAGAHCLSRLVLNKGEWTKQHVHYSGYTWTQMKPLVTMMIECCDKPRLHHAAVYEKYKDRRFKEASIIVQRALDSGFTLPHHTMPVRRSASHAASLDDGSGSLPYINGMLVPTEG